MMDKVRKPSNSKEIILQILLEDLRKREICAKFVPYRLTEEQKQRKLT
jgi:hypothetical protein